jgi:hypothetical protein
MNRWLRRSIYTVITLLWLVVMLLPAFAFLLAARGELQVGSSRQNQVRFFMLQQPDADGVGIEWTRPIRQQNQTICTRTSVRYLLWEGEGEPVNTCRCYTETGEVMAAEQAACEP